MSVTEYSDYQHTKFKVLPSCKMSCSYCPSLNSLSSYKPNSVEIKKAMEKTEGVKVFPCNSIFDPEMIEFLKSSPENNIRLQVHGCYLSDTKILSQILELSPEKFELEILLDEFNEDIYPSLKNLSSRFKTNFVLIGTSESYFFETLNELPNFILKSLIFNFPKSPNRNVETLNSDQVFGLFDRLNKYGFSTPNGSNLYRPSKHLEIKSHSFDFKKKDAESDIDYSIIVVYKSELDRETLIKLEKKIFESSLKNVEFIVGTSSSLIRRHSFGSWKPNLPTRWIDIKSDHCDLSLGHILNECIETSTGKKVIIGSPGFIIEELEDQNLLQKLSSSQILINRKCPLDFMSIDRTYLNESGLFSVELNHGLALTEDLISRLEKQSLSTSTFESKYKEKSPFYGEGKLEDELQLVFQKHLNPKTYQEHRETMGKFKLLRKILSVIFAPLAFVFNIPPIKYLFLFLTWPLRKLHSKVTENPKLKYIVTFEWLNVERFYHFWKVHIYTVFWPYFFLKKHIWRLLEPFHFLKKYFWWIKKPYYFLYHQVTQLLAKIWLLKKPFYYLYHLVTQFVGRLWVVKKIYHFFRPIFNRIAILSRDHIWYNIRRVWYTIKDLGYLLKDAVRGVFYLLRRVFYMLRNLYWRSTKIYWYIKQYLWHLKRPFYAPIGFAKSLFEYPEEIYKLSFFPRVLAFIKHPIKKVLWLMLYPFRRNKPNDQSPQRS